MHTNETIDTVVRGSFMKKNQEESRAQILGQWYEEAQGKVGALKMMKLCLPWLL